ncbi:DNA phosphorothioation-dependent restriction protein DptG [Halobacillus salinus]|uniref:DNA phosphorothioation-dependent restriction protein DptG n=1 Tax=Halobacillus salinus TaxID=192814 RepID=UPI0009A8C281|nr:DNA phosphorothioation-dependent restriction protein DptG [Halobacillus salinus]
MSGYFNFEEINRRLTNKQNENGLSSHDTGNVKHAFPFTSSKLSNVFSKGINEIIGELVRLANNLESAEFVYEGDFTYSENPLINNVIERVDFPSGGSEEVLAGFLEDYLFADSTELKPLHLYLFNYIDINGEKNEKEKYSRFIYDSLFYSYPEISSLFSSTETDNLLTELIITSLPELKERKGSKKVTKTKYTNVFPELNELFVKDFLFLSKHKDYFINHFFNIIHFYIYQYVLQFLIKAQKFGEDEWGKQMAAFHYTFDWETGVGGYREAVEDYQFVKNNARNLFVHIHCMSHLSHNEEEFNSEHELKSYKELLHELNLLNSDEQKHEKEKLIQWIKAYTELIQGNISEEVNLNSDFPTLFKSLFDQLKVGMSDDVCEKYGKNIDNLGKGRFLKARGKHGYILSLKQEDFLMLSAVAVGENKIPLKTFFKELKSRGVVFDQYSKKEAVKLLEQQNYIEKKSDSGDAQYVKPIL